MRPQAHPSSSSRPRERDAGDEAVPDFEVVEARFGLMPGFASELKYHSKTDDRFSLQSGPPKTAAG